MRGTQDALATRRTEREKGQVEGWYMPLGPKSCRWGGFPYRRYGVSVWTHLANGGASVSDTGQ